MVCYATSLLYCIPLQRHPGGVASVGFKEAESASACVGAMNGRWYAGRQLNVCVWDGVTNYQVILLVLVPDHHAHERGSGDFRRFSWLFARIWLHNSI